MTLTEIFAKTDTLAYGPFRLEKAPGRPFEDARFFVKEVEISLSARKKEIMAVLISQQGFMAGPDLMREAIPQSKFSAEKAGLLKVQICQIKKQMAAQLAGKAPRSLIDALLDCIASASPDHKKGRKRGTRTSEYPGQYKLFTLDHNRP